MSTPTCTQANPWRQDWSTNTQHPDARPVMVWLDATPEGQDYEVRCVYCRPSRDGSPVLIPQTTVSGSAL